MKNLTDEIKLTIEMMQGDIDDGAHGELQSHLYSLLEMKRELLRELVPTDTPITPNWTADADERIDVMWNDPDDNERYLEALIGKRAGGGIIIGFEGDDAIIMASSSWGPMNWYVAVEFCEAFFHRVHNDWRLPTKDQLNLAWVNRDKLQNLNIGDFFYWSKTQLSTSHAWVETFRNGSQSTSSMDTLYRVRPVRSVKIENLEFEGSDIMGDA